MNYSFFIYFSFFFVRLAFTVDYYDVDDDDDHDEKQVPFRSISPLSQNIHHLTSTIFDSLSQSNSSISSLFFSDHMINFENLGISSIDIDVFINYPHPIVTISFASNFLSFLPSKVFQPFSSSLMNLNLQRNQFRSLHRNYFLRRLEQLRTLDLSENLLNRIVKQDFTGLRRLETLILRKNHLTSLSYATFSRCRTITTLDLSENQISRIDPNAFRSLFRLKTLLLNNNPLGQRALQSYLLEPLKKLDHLDLENTELENLPPFLFMFNENLRSIKLRRNHFKNNDDESETTLQRTFCRANSLVEIDLVGTHLRSLDVCTYDQVPSLRRLYLMNNPLDCTCDLFYLKYGDIYRVLLTDGNGIDREHSNVDGYLDRWINRPELRRHLEMSYERGDFHRLPIELSLFARCATPEHWQGREISNITGIFLQCQHRWSQLEDQCHNYCQLNQDDIETSLTTNSSIESFGSKVEFERFLWIFSSIVGFIYFHF